MEYFAMISGRTPAETQPVMAVSPGPLELLPCHLHPPGWLKAFVSKPGVSQPIERMALPKADPYSEIYREPTAWFRLIDPALIDPGDRHRFYKGQSGERGARAKASDAVGKAETFHKNVIGNYYHPNTWAFYGNDPKYWSFGTIRWLGHCTDPEGPTEAELLAAKPTSSNLPGQVVAQCIPGGSNRAKSGSAEGTAPAPGTAITFKVQLQDTRGDGTVNWQSGSAPGGQLGVKRLFATTGYDHQGGYKDEPMRLLTLYLICKIAQGAS
jgi:hypothetical protein